METPEYPRPEAPDLGPPLPRSFYLRPADEVGPDLLGAFLAVRDEEDKQRVGRIVEVEAYLGEEDLACHAARGLTPRTRTLYGPAGTAYVYLVYGVHELFNVVCQPEGVPHAVLVRAVELGQPAAASRGAGPGKLTRALGIGRQHDGSSLLTPPITVHAGPPPERLEVTARVGVAYAMAWAEAPLRYFDPDSKSVSRPPSGRIGLGAPRLKRPGRPRTRPSE